MHHRPSHVAQGRSILTTLALGLATFLTLFDVTAVVVAMPGIASSIPDYPAGVAESMIKNDFAWASDNRTRILAEWTKRYEGKAAKKN